MEFSFLHGVLIFSKVWVSDCKLRWLFSLLLTRVISCDIDPWERLDIIILLCPPPFYLKGCQICPMFFLERESWSQPYQMFLIALSLIMPPNIQFGFGDEAIWRKVWQGVVFMQNFWNFKAIPKTEIILTSIQSRLILKKFKWFLWRGFQMWWKLFCFDFLMKNMKWHLVGHKKVEISMRVNENRVSTKMWRTRSDIRLVTKRFKFQFEGHWELFQSIHFICMNNDFVSHEKALPTDPDCLPLIRKGLIRHVT